MTIFIVICCNIFLRILSNNTNYSQRNCSIAHFLEKNVVARLETGPLGSHLDALATTLQNQRYATSTISIYLREAHAFGCWANERHRLGELSGLALQHYLDDLSTQPGSVTRNRRRKITTAVHLLLNHLRQAGVIASPPAESLPLTEAQQWLTRYEEHLGKVLGLAPTLSYALQSIGAESLP